MTTPETDTSDPPKLKKKTFKREVSVVLLSFLCYVIFQGNVEMVKVIVYPFMSFAALSFGLDWKSKQG